MSRTPTADATALAGQIGQRGTTVINSYNRALVRKWLTASGVGSDIVNTATMAELGEAYNDTTDAALDRLTGRTTESTPPLEAAAQPTAPAPAAPAGAVNPQAMALLAQLAAVMAPQTGQGLTPEQARAIAADEVRRAQLPQPLEVTVHTATGSTTTTGHRHKAFEAALRMVGAGLKVALIGPAGSGKTTLAAQVAEALGVKFLYTGAVDSPYRLTGFIDAQGRYVRTAFRDAYEHGGLFLWDEVDSSDPGALLAFNAALENGTADFPDGNIERSPDFKVMAAANTYGTGASREYVGRSQLDAATLDRFSMLEVGYDSKLELSLAGNDDWTRQVQAWRAAAGKLKIRHIISPRASINGAKLLAAGLARDVTEEAVVWKGLDRDSVTKIKQAA